MINEQVMRDLITREEAVNSAAKKYLTKALSISAEMEADLSELTLLDGDILLLCTDGLSNMITDEIMLKRFFAPRVAALVNRRKEGYFITPSGGKKLKVNGKEIAQRYDRKTAILWKWVISSCNSISKIDLSAKNAAK